MKHLLGEEEDKSVVGLDQGMEESEVVEELHNLPLEDLQLRFEVTMFVEGTYSCTQVVEQVGLVRCMAEEMKVLCCKWFETCSW